MRIFAILILFICLDSQAGELVTRSAGQVGDHIVTTREAQINSLIEKALAATTIPKNAEKEKWLPEVDSAGFSQEITAVLLEWVVFYEAENFAVANIANGEASSAQVKVEETFKGVHYWQKLEVSSAELSEMVSRKLRAKKFIRFKTDSTEVTVTDDEAKDYFEKNRVKFGTLPFTAFRDNIRAYLGRQQLDQRLREWFEVLKRKYKVRNFDSEKGR